MGDAWSRIGTTTSGKPAYLHPAAAAAWDGLVALAQQRLGIDLTKRIVQAYGDAVASAGTHGAPPVAVDIRSRGITPAGIEKLVALARECGFAATWYRDWEGNQHIHAATDIGAWSPALYQVTAVKAGYDGLGAGGRKGKDPHPKPSVWRDAKTGAAWARAQLQTNLERLLDTMTEEDLKMIVRGQVDAALMAPPSPGAKDEWGNSLRDSAARAAYRANAAVGHTLDLATSQQGGFAALQLRLDAQDAELAQLRTLVGQLVATSTDGSR